MDPARAPIAIVAPAFNEEAIIERFLVELRAALDTIDGVDFAIVIVDDGSTDGTLGVLNRLAAADSSLRVYSLSRNFGHQAAITCGLDAATDFDAVVVMDADLQHPPALIPTLVDRWREGFDVVQTVRVHTDGTSLPKRLSSSAFYRMFNRLSPVAIREGAADFYLLSQRALRALVSLREKHRFLRGLVSWTGFPSTSVEYVAPARPAGDSKYGLSQMTGLAADAILSFSALPIRAATRVGLLLAVLGFAYLGYVVVRAIWLGDVVQGWPSVISVVLILGGAQIMVVGLLGAYIARIFDEVKGRPLYVLKQRPDSSFSTTSHGPDG